MDTVHWAGTGADHVVILWMMKDLRVKFRSNPMVKKRVWKDFTKEHLAELADKVDWSTKSNPRWKW